MSSSPIASAGVNGGHGRTDRGAHAFRCACRVLVNALHLLRFIAQGGSSLKKMMTTSVSHVSQASGGASEMNRVPRLFLLPSPEQRLFAAAGPVRSELPTGPNRTVPLDGDLPLRPQRHAHPRNSRPLASTSSSHALMFMPGSRTCPSVSANK